MEQYPSFVSKCFTAASGVRPTESPSFHVNFAEEIGTRAYLLGAFAEALLSKSAEYYLLVAEKSSKVCVVRHSIIGKTISVSLKPHRDWWHLPIYAPKLRRPLPVRGKS